MPLAIHPKQEARRLELADVTGSRQQRSVHLQSWDRPQELGDFAHQMLSAPDTRVSISSRDFGKNIPRNRRLANTKTSSSLEKPMAPPHQLTPPPPSPPPRHPPPPSHSL